MTDVVFARLTEGLCIRFWGKPTDKTAKSLRWGSGGSRSFNIAEMVWYDHEAGKGGGAIALVMREVGTDRDGALAWMQKEGLIEARHARADAQQRQEVPPTSEDCPEPEQPPAGSAEPVAKAIEGYRYTDGDGETLYEVIRYHFQYPDGTWQLGKSGNPKKTFKQRRPDGKGGYIWGLGDVQHTLWRRQELEQAIERGDTIYLPEGEKDGKHTLLPWGLECTTNSGGAQNWRPEFADLLRGADVVILGDDDEPGQKRVDTIARDLRGKAKRLRAIYSWGGPKDVTDWREAGGTIEQFTAMVAALPDWRPRPPQSKFGAIGLDQLHQPHLKHEFLIDGFLDRRGVAMMPGASGSAKTFLTLEMGMCIALNRDFWGMQVKPGLVLYQAGEGKEGVTKRIDGWLLDRDVPPSAEVPFKVLPRKVNLFVDDKDTDDLIEEAKAWAEYYEQPVRLVIIDTFNKAITGANENAGQDMGRVLSRLERISESLDCAVLVPMHKSKQGDMRGHTSLMGDASNVLNVTKLEIRDGNSRQIRTVSLDKNKDGEGGHPMRFVLRQVVLGEDENGTPRTTCVVDRPNGDEEALVAEGKLSLNQTLFLQTLRDSIDIEGEDAPSGVTGVPRGKRVVQYKAFAARLWNKWPFTAPEHEVEKRKKEFSTQVGAAGKRLVAHGYVERHNDTGLIWWTGKSDRPPRQPKPEKPGAGIAPDVKQEIASMGDVPF